MKVKKIWKYISDDTSADTNTTHPVSQSDHVMSWSASGVTGLIELIERVGLGGNSSSLRASPNMVGCSQIVVGCLKFQI